MKHRKFILCVAILAAAGISALVFQHLAHRSTEPGVESANSPAVEPLTTTTEVGPAAADPSPPSSARPRRPPAVAPAIALVPEWSVVVRADQVLATINGQPIQLKDLVSLGPDGTERAMTEEQYRSRLNRAIEMELTAQAAQAQGVGLSAEQQQRLTKIGRDHRAKLREYQQQGISWSSATTAQLEFERRLMSALMLQQNLVAKEAAVAPSPDTSVQARYEQALSEMLGRLKATAAVQVSNPTL